MPKIYLLPICLLFFLNATSQIKKESVLLGGQLYYYNYKYHTAQTEQKTQSATISLSAGKAFKDNKVFGLNFSFSPIKQSNFRTGTDTINMTTNRFDAGIFYKEYKKLARDFYFFFQTDASFVTGKQTMEYKVAANNVNAKQRGALLSVMPGFSYQVFKNMQLEITVPNLIMLQYLSTKTTTQNPQVSNSEESQFTFNSIFNNNNNGLGSLGVGFRFIL